MRIRKKESEKIVDRRIPEADLTGFETPNISKVRTLNNSDKGLLESLTSELKKTGAIDRDSVLIEGRQSLYELGEIFSEAKEHQKYEKDINPAFYDEEADAFLENRQITEGDLFENPSLDGIDDYGTQVYDRFVETADYDSSVSDIDSDLSKNNKVDENYSKTAAIRLSDGKIIYGEIL